jgi:single-strand DNA-binding protein
MNDTAMTIIGNVVDEPRMRMTKSGYAVTNFRLASTPRRFDREHNTWVDCTTLYVNVSCWRGLAEHVASSVHKGQPVLVTGRYFAREYEIDETKRIAYELDAGAVGHDLSRGTAEFTRVARTYAPAQVIEIDEGGVPADRSDSWHDLVEPVSARGADEAAEPRQLASAS